MATTFDLPVTHEMYRFEMEVLVSLPRNHAVVATELASDTGTTMKAVAEAAERLIAEGYDIGIGMRQLPGDLSGRKAKCLWVNERGWRRVKSDGEYYWMVVHDDSED